MTITNARIKVVAQGSPVLSYQWYSEGDPDPVIIDGATSRTLFLEDVNTSIDQTRYMCIITNPYGTVQSDWATLTVWQIPLISDQPDSENVVTGMDIVLSLTASGNPSELTYAWYKDSVAISNGGRVSGATTSQITISTAEAGDAASYTCIVTNSAGSRTSSAAVITIASDNPFDESYWLCHGGYNFSESLINQNNTPGFLNRYISNVAGLTINMVHTWEQKGYSSDSYATYNGIGLSSFSGSENCTPAFNSNAPTGVWAIELRSTDSPYAFIGNFDLVSWSSESGALAEGVAYETTVDITVGPDLGGNTYDITYRIRIPDASIDQTITDYAQPFTNGHAQLWIAGGFLKNGDNLDFITALTVTEA